MYEERAFFRFRFSKGYQVNDVPVKNNLSQFESRKGVHNGDKGMFQSNWGNLKPAKRIALGLSEHGTLRGDRLAEILDLAVNLISFSKWRQFPKTDFQRSPNGHFLPRLFP